MNFLKFNEILKNFYLKKFNIISKKQLYLPNKYKKYFSDSSQISLISRHKNNTKLVFFKEENFFRKFSQNKEGIKKINFEISALRWYSKKIKRKIIKNNLVEKKFAFLDTYSFKGKKIKSWNSLTNNYKYVIQVIDHYKKVFNKKKYHKIHGDLTFDNIFVQKTGVTFFDWEFFGARKQPWGYDLIYFILSTICIPFIESGRFSKKEEIYFTNLWGILKKNRIDKKILLDPFKCIEKNLNTDKIFISSKKISKSKFFPFYTPISFKKKIINIILKNYE